MSTTLSTAAMVTLLQSKSALGISNGYALDRLNEAFRKINQMSKGGFVWQLRQTSLVVPPGAQVGILLPTDFDPGKTAILRGNSLTSFGATSTMIAYLPWKDFVNHEHYQTSAPNFFSTWTFFPNFLIPTNYLWSIFIGPTGAFPTTGGSLPFVYHALNQAPIASGGNFFFPTPDQFDSLIVDLALAEVRSIYRLTGAEELFQRTMQAVADIIDTYRSDRYDLAGVSDQMAQAQEKAAEKAK